MGNLRGWLGWRKLRGTKVLSAGVNATKGGSGLLVRKESRGGSQRHLSAVNGHSFFIFAFLQRWIMPDNGKDFLKDF
jgi:hypothetical protein